MSSRLNKIVLICRYIGIFMWVVVALISIIISLVIDNIFFKFMFIIMLLLSNILIELNFAAIERQKNKGE